MSKRTIKKLEKMVKKPKKISATLLDGRKVELDPSKQVRSFPAVVPTEAQNVTVFETKQTIFEHTQQHEAESWCIADEQVRNDKASREVIRYPLLKKQMGLDHLDTSNMVVWDIGGGPLGGVSSILNCKYADVIEPLTEEFKKYYPCWNYTNEKAENLKERLSIPDLVIITNALDHFEQPQRFLADLATFMKPGAYFAHVHAINNAFSHPHEAHAHNVNPPLFQYMLQHDFETVWYEDFQRDGLTYGWRRQKAFSGLYRKVTGYK